MYPYYNASNSLPLYNIPNSQFLELTVPHYNLMDNSCSEVLFEGFSNMSGSPTYLGQIPYSVISCSATSHNATFILRSKTLSGFTYNSLFMYFDSRVFVYNPNTTVYPAWNEYNLIGGNTIGGLYNFYNINDTLHGFDIQLNAPLDTNSLLEQFGNKGTLTGAANIVARNPQVTGGADTNYALYTNITTLYNLGCLSS